MLRRNHFNWLSSVQNSRFAMVQKFVMVFPSHIQLFFLWRKFSRLFRSGHQSSGNFIDEVELFFSPIVVNESIDAGISSIFGNISSVPLIYAVLYWIRLVRFVAGEKVLHEAV